MNAGTTPFLRFQVFQTRRRTANIKPYLKKNLTRDLKNTELTPHPRLIYTNDFKTVPLCCTGSK